MKASSVRANAGIRSASADKAGKKGGQTRARTHGQPSPLISPALKAGWPGGGTEGMAGELASMPPIQRQSAANSLQSTRGNSFVQRLAIQAKLKVGPAGDNFEMQADQVADQVMGMTEPANPVQRQEGGTAAKPLASSITPLLQRVTSFITLPLQRQGEEEEIQTKPLVQRQGEEEEIQTKPMIQRQGEEEEIQTKPLVQRQGEEEEIQTKSTSASSGFEAGSAFESRLSATRGGGRPLPGSLREQMEAGFGADFSGVRVHTGGEAAQLNSAVSAQAFTHGQDIYLGEGRSNLESSAGKKLLAHELTHTIQQTGAVQRRTPGPVESVSRTPQGIQRLMSEKELMAKAGKPKHDILFHKMSTHYKKVLSAVGEYDSYLSVQPVARSQNGNVFAQEGKAILDSIKAAATEYLTVYPKSKRVSGIKELLNQIEPEKKALDNAAANYDKIKNLPGRNALSVAASLPSTPAPMPPKPTTLPPVPTTFPPKPTTLPPVPTTLPPTPKPLPPLPTSKPPTKPVPPPKPTTLPPLPTSKPPNKSVPPTPTALPSAPVATTPVATQPLIPAPLPESEYLENIKGTGGAYPWLSEQSRAVASMGWSPAVPGGLSEAQWTAIRVYTSGDYRYINPVLINAPGWLKSGMDPTDQEVIGNWISSIPELQTELTDPEGFLKKLKQMALEHSAMIIEGLKKLPPFKGKAYRGESRTVSVYQGDYQPGKTIEKGHFLSTSQESSQSMQFAKDVPSESPPKRGILWEINANGNKGRDISKISLFEHEKEVLFMPGSKFRINTVDPVSGPRPLNVKMDET